ncbi:hypothetical protein [Celeribacter sp.]|uniref:hypothetical protein n=1 Tax=Celeribacter sp. TaxID=1890673 RepID=UPI003A90E9EF
MAEAKLIKSSLKAGIWEGVLTLSDPDAEAPEIQVTHRDQPIGGHTLIEIPERAGLYAFQFVIPSDLINDGVETFLFTNRETGEPLGSCVVLAGDSVSDDVRAEIDLMRAELDMLKRAFRRHCIETDAV